MIHYQLRCSQGHGFEGWFRDSVAFEEQSARKLLSCPQCGTIAVDRALMAPAVRTRKRPSVAEAAPTAPAEAAKLPVPASEAVLPDQLRAALQRMRAEIERNCDNVGDGFAEAARRLHRGESPNGAKRGIYGRVTEPEREALAEEGIETTQIPWLPRADG